MLNRRTFLRQTAMAAGSLLAAPVIGSAAGLFEEAARLTILHTNDTHSRIDPFPMDGGRNQGLGGVASRSRLIDTVRKEEDQVLLLDAGDIFQGTPYFNLYKGEPELKCMTAMGYDAATIGNHDFDAGVENLADQLQAHASFPMIISNYDFTGTAMEGKYMPYKIFRKGKLKIGVTGVGIELQGVVPQNLYGKTVYLDPVQKLNESAYELKKNNCDLVICLSHLGYEYKENKISDILLAKETENVDLIIGGHTHTFLDKPRIIQNKKGQDVVINQVGFAGIQLGRLDYVFDASGKKKLQAAKAITVTKKTSE
jgi:5'-nucleotidase